MGSGGWSAPPPVTGKEPAGGGSTVLPFPSGPPYSKQRQGLFEAVAISLSYARADSAAGVVAPSLMACVLQRSKAIIDIINI